MNYEKRSELRRECSKFLRFSYLVDFLAMEALSRIFINSVRDLQDRLEKLCALDIEYVVKEAPAAVGAVNAGGAS